MKTDNFYEQNIRNIILSPIDFIFLEKLYNKWMFSHIMFCFRNIPCPLYTPPPPPRRVSSSVWLEPNESYPLEENSNRWWNAENILSSILI